MRIAGSGAEAVREADAVVTMLPAGKHVLSVWQDLLPAAKPGTLIIDSSTIDVESARKAHAMAKERGCRSLDAPVSGGVGGAKAATLTFMCGGTENAFAQGRADPRQDGQARRPLRRGRRRPGGEDLQQHDPRHLDDRRLRGLRPRREARPVAPGAVRRRVELVRPVLVPDELLPGARPRAGIAREQRLQARLRRRR